MAHELDINPQLEADGSYRPSVQALAYATSDFTDYEETAYVKYNGKKSRILVICTEQKNMTMANGKMFSTGNHPVETLVPMLHLKNAGFGFEIATPNGRPAVLEHWAMPTKDENVMGLFGELKSKFDNPTSLKDFVGPSLGQSDRFAALFIPGGHGAMLGLPEDQNVGKVLQWAHDNDLFTTTICHGPGALISTSLESGEFLYAGYSMAVFPDALDKETPKFGYLPGDMPWHLGEKLTELGVNIINTEADKSCHVDRKLITGASPAAANDFGKLVASTLLKTLHR